MKLPIRGPDLDPYTVAKRVLGPSLRFLFPTRVEGLGHVPARGPVVLAPNHLSIVDSILLAHVVPRRITFVAKAEHFDDWRSGWAMRLTNQIPLRRGSMHAAGRAMTAAGDVLEEGGVIGLFPEGTRSRDGLLHAGNHGPAWLALTHGVPIVPIGLIGTDAVHAPGELLPHAGRVVTIRFGPPIDAGTLRLPSQTRRAREVITEHLMATIAALSGQQRADAPAAPTRIAS